jgi:hypothetical protein
MNAGHLRSTIIGLLAEVDPSGIVFRIDCGWSVRSLVVAALIWAWSGRASLQERLAQSRRLVGRLGVGSSPQKVSYQAFLKLLVRWTPELRSRLMSAYRSRMLRDFADSFRTFGFSLFAGDGSKLQLPRTRSNEARFSPRKSRKRPRKQRGRGRSARRPRSLAARQQRSRDKKGDSPQMALTKLFHLELRLPWDWRIGPYDASERGHLREMIPDLPDDALVVADCGFVGYDFWSELLASGRQFVIRAGGNVRLLRKLGRVRESHGTIYLWPDTARKRQQEPLTLRVVEVHDGRQSWFLVTSVRDTNRLSDRQVAEIYRRRWRIELYFRHLKQTFGRAKLRSHKAEHAAIEAEWSLLGLWGMLLHARGPLEPPNGPPLRGQISVAKVLLAFRQALDEPDARPGRGESLRELLARAIVTPRRNHDRTSRGYPRKKYEPDAKPPRVTLATPKEIQIAKQIAGDCRAKGLTP